MVFIPLISFIYFSSILIILIFFYFDFFCDHRPYIDLLSVGMVCDIFFLFVINFVGPWYLFWEDFSLSIFIEGFYISLLPCKKNFLVYMTQMIWDCITMLNDLCFCKLLLIGFLLHCFFRFDVRIYLKLFCLKFRCYCIVHWILRQNFFFSF